MRSLVAAIALALLPTIDAAVGGALEDGALAFQQGDYARAFSFWQPLAKQGSAAAEYGIGLMYDEGHGVKQDYDEAFKWYQLAAEQGNPFGQFGIGSLYFAGRTAQDDDVAAYMWLSLAAAQGLADAAKLRDLTAQSMTPSQIAQARKLSENWKPRPQ